jgi:hypothetical protein
MEEQTVNNELGSTWKAVIGLKFLLLFQPLLEEVRIAANRRVIVVSLKDDM